MYQNILLLDGSYKYNHSSQYPSNMVGMYDYMESHGELYQTTKFVGLQYYLKKYLSTSITVTDVEEAFILAKAHGIPFDYVGWSYIATELQGTLPVRIKAVPEGSVIPVRNVLMTIEATDINVPWIAGWLETLLMKVWYPTTIATRAYYVKNMLLKYGSADWVSFAFHNFGDRGSSSVESAAIGGIAHLSVGFLGTDNFNSLRYAKEYYNEEIAGFSVFAAAHSSTTSFGKDEEEAFVYIQVQSNPDAPILSFVSDNYDVYNFTDFCTNPTSRIRQLLETRPHQTFVLRPDSGDPITVITRMLEILKANNVGYTTQQKDRRLLKNYRILWGNGITAKDIQKILECVISLGYSAENFIFGSDGWLMQHHNRDILGFAVKCSQITVDEGSPIDNGDGGAEMEHFFVTKAVFEDLITDPGKKSKKGKVTTYYNPTTSTYFVDQVGMTFENNAYEVLVPVYENGKLLVDDSLSTIRKRN